VSGDVEVLPAISRNLVQCPGGGLHRVDREFVYVRPEDSRLPIGCRCRHRAALVGARTGGVIPVGDVECMAVLAVHEQAETYEPGAVVSDNGMVTDMIDDVLRMFGGETQLVDTHPHR